MDRYCLICTPRSGSFYVQRYISKVFDLEFGSEWFGRVKQVHYDGMKTSPVDIDHSVNEDLLTNAEITNRLVHLMNYNKPSIIKCMPFQLCNTLERKNLLYTDKMDIAQKILSHFKLIYMQTNDKVTQFCFDIISKNQDHVKRNFTSYKTEIRETPPDNSMTASRAEFDNFCERQNFVKDFQDRTWKGEPVIVWEDFVNDHNKEMRKIEDWYKLETNYVQEKRDIIPHPDYSKIFTNYGDIEQWFG